MNRFLIARLNKGAVLSKKYSAKKHDITKATTADAK